MKNTSVELPFYKLLVCFCLGLTPVGHVIINDFHDVSDEVGNKATKLLWMMCLYPFIDGLVRSIMMILSILEIAFFEDSDEEVIRFITHKI